MPEIPTTPWSRRSSSRLRRLRQLDGDAFASLGRAGHLEPIYMMLASVARFRDLIDRVNRAGAAGR